MRLPRLPIIAARWLLAGLPLLLMTTAAHAHQVWLEQDASAAKLYFGEFGDNLHEVSPGFLDKLAQVSATVITSKGEKAIDSKRERDGIILVGRAGKGESVVAVDLAYPLLENKDGAKTVRTAWTPAARYIPELGPQPAKLALDVVPTNGSGEFQVVYRGAPLPKAEVSLIAVSGWSLSGTTDDKGKVGFRLPWKGTYALLVRHKDATPGKRKGAQGAEEAYDAASFATTLTFADHERAALSSRAASGTPEQALSMLHGAFGRPPAASLARNTLRRPGSRRR